MMINTCIFAYPVGRTFLTEITEGKEAEDDKLQTPVSHSHKSFQLSFITFLLTIFPLYTTWLFRLPRVSLYSRFDLRLVSNVCKEAPISVFWTSTQWRIQGEGAPPQDLTLVWDWNSYIDRIVYHFLTGWFFLMRCALHFATKLNSRNIQKCHCFCVPSNDLFASARRSSISRANGNQRSQIEKHVTVSVKCDLPQKSSTVLSEPKFGPPPPPTPTPIKNSWIHPCSGRAI